MAQAPMISVPVKRTNEIDWITPLKSYIQNTYGDDPEHYAEECATLNRLRQDMRGAGNDNTSGRDLLYRYYGQLELLDLRFPVDEQHIKISFTWYDAFTSKPTSQHSLAFEKASIIFNISAVLSAHAALQGRNQEAGVKTAYHSFQAAAGMFTYINENFLHAPSCDLSRDTVKTLINIMLAQAQEVFLEKGIADQKKNGMLAKLASQAAVLYAQAVEGVQENVSKAVFEKVWLLLVQAKFNLMGSMAQYYQALADDDANNHGIAIARLQVAEALAKEAIRAAGSFPGSSPPAANLPQESGQIMGEIGKRHLTTVQEKLREFSKDNDYIYHQTIPAEASVQPVPKLPASKPIPVSELYAGQDIQRITGPDLFAKIVPFAVTESASLYDEEKAKLLRAETERVDMANSEMAASLDYLRLPGALQVLKGGFDQDTLPDDEFRTWCTDVADNDPPASIFEYLHSEKKGIIEILEKCSKQLDMEESVCEKMRSKYENDWTQQPSSRLTTTLRNDIRNYREALDEAAKSDGQLAMKLRQNDAEFDDMRTAAQNGDVDGLFQRAIAKTRGRSSNSNSPAMGAPNLLDTDFESGPSVAEQISRVEDLLKKLSLIKRERVQVLKDLKEKAHNDDISQILILNKKSFASYEQQLFQSELEKYRPHQTRLTQAGHKQAAVMKELTSVFNNLLQDKRVRSEQNKYESIQRQRSSVVNKYKRAYQEFLDLVAGLQGAKRWYTEMRETVQSLEKNVETFINNRRSEGAQLLNQIEQERAATKTHDAALEQERLKSLMERMSIEPPASPGKLPSSRPTPAPLSFSTAPAPTPSYPKTNFAGQYQLPSSPAPQQTIMPQSYNPQVVSQGYLYNPSSHGRIPGPASPPPTQTAFAMGPQRQGPQSPHSGQTTFSLGRGPASPSPGQSTFLLQQPQSGQRMQSSNSNKTASTYGNPVGQYQNQQQPTYVPPGFVPPPPPPGPPPLGPQQTFHYNNTDYYQNPGSQAMRPPSAQQPQQQHQCAQQTQSDPWAGLSAWK